MVATVHQSATEWNPALVEMYRTHFDSLRKLAARIVGRAHADEIVQDVFVRYHARRCAPAPGREYSYLRSMVRNQACTVLRKQARSRDIRKVREVQDSIEDLYQQRDEVGRVNQAIAARNGRQAEVIELRYLHGLSETETAARLGISCGTVKQHSSRARAVLRQALDPS